MATKGSAKATSVRCIFKAIAAAGMPKELQAAAD